MADGALLPQHSHAAVMWGNFHLVLPAREKAVCLHSPAPPLSFQVRVERNQLLLSLELRDWESKLRKIKREELDHQAFLCFPVF